MDDLNEKILRNNYIGVILAAGTGSRMGSLTNNLPKPLLKVRNRQIISFPIESVKYAGITEIIIVVGYKYQSFDEYNNNYQIIVTNPDYNIFYSVFDILRKIDGTKTAIFLDGDTILPKESVSSSLREFEKESKLNITGFLSITKRINNGSHWNYSCRGGNIINDVIPSREKIGRIAIGFQIEPILSILEDRIGIENILEHKFNNQFIKGYENYLLGWGLLLKIISNKLNIVLINQDIEIININSPTDLTHNNSFIYGIE